MPPSAPSATEARGPGPCIIWPYACTIEGYPKITLNRKVRTVTRLVLMAVDGPDHLGMDVAHRPIICHTPSCIRPDHLRWATRAENVADCVLDGTASSVKEPSKLGIDQVREIRARYALGGIGYRPLGAEYGVTFQTINDIITGKTWADLG